MIRKEEGLMVACKGLLRRVDVLGDQEHMQAKIIMKGQSSTILEFR